MVPIQLIRLDARFQELLVNWLNAVCTAVPNLIWFSVSFSPPL